MSLSNAQADKVNRMNPVTQEVALGTEIARLGGEIAAETTLSAKQLIAIKYALTADATGAGLAITIPYAMEIVDVIVQARATSAVATVKLATGAGDITNLIACAADTTVTRVGTIDDSKSSITTSTALKVIASAADVRALITIVGYRS